jgi:hypothetical protein
MCRVSVNVLGLIDRCARHRKVELFTSAEVTKWSDVLLCAHVCVCVCVCVCLCVRFVQRTNRTHSPLNMMKFAPVVTNTYGDHNL